MFFFLHQASIQRLADGFAVHFLTNEYQFLHAVAVLLVPVATKHRVGSQLHLQFVLRHRGDKLTTLLDTQLLAGLLEEIAHIVLLLEIAHSLATDNRLGPMARHELVEQTEVEGTAAVIDKSINTILVGFA